MFVFAHVRVRVGVQVCRCARVRVYSVCARVYMKTLFVNFNIPAEESWINMTVTSSNSKRKESSVV